MSYFFTISRLTICRNSVVKYKYQPSKSLENALFSAFYLSKLFIVGKFFVPTLGTFTLLFTPLNSSNSLCQFVSINVRFLGVFWSSIGLFIIFWSEYFVVPNRGLFSKIHPYFLLNSQVMLW